MEINFRSVRRKYQMFLVPEIDVLRLRTNVFSSRKNCSAQFPKKSLCRLTQPLSSCSAPFSNHFRMRSMALHFKKKNIVAKMLFTMSAALFTVQKANLFQSY